MPGRHLLPDVLRPKDWSPVGRASRRGLTPHGAERARAEPGQGPPRSPHLSTEDSQQGNIFPPKKVKTTVVSHHNLQATVTISDSETSRIKKKRKKLAEFLEITKPAPCDQPPPAPEGSAAPQGANAQTRGAEWSHPANTPTVSVPANPEARQHRRSWLRRFGLETQGRRALLFSITSCLPTPRLSVNCTPINCEF